MNSRARRSVQPRTREETTCSPRLALDARVLGGRFDGVGRFLYGIANELCGRPDLDIVLLTRPDTSARYVLDELISRPGVSVCPFPSSPTSVSQQFAWRAKLREIRPDAIFIPYQLSAPLWSGPPTVTMINDCILEVRPETKLRVRIPYMAFTRLLLRQSEIVCPSQEARRDVERIYRRHVPSEHVISEGLEASFLKRLDAERIRSVRTALGLDRPYILHLGARRPHKNIAHLVEVLSAVRKQTGRDLTLALAGAPDERFADPVPEAIRKYGVADHCIELGPVPEDILPALYAGAAVFCFPSMAEGFGLPLVEAMASSVPVVASDLPVFREIAGDSIRYAAPTDVRAWTEEVIAALTPGADAVRRRDDARAIAAETTWSAAAERLLAVILQTIQRRSSLGS